MGPYGGPDACVKSHQAAKRLYNGPEGKDVNLDRYEFDTTRNTTSDRAKTEYAGDSAHCATCRHCWRRFRRSDSGEKTGKATRAGDVNRPQQLPSLPTDALPGLHLGSCSC